MAESAALNSRQISRMHNKATSHGNPFSLSLSPPIYFAYLFHFPAARFNGKERSPGIVFPLFISFSNWQRSVNLTGDTYVLLPLPLGSDFELEPRDFIEKLSFSLFSFYLEEQRSGHHVEERRKKKSRRGVRCLKHSRTVDRGHDRVYEREEEAEAEEEEEEAENVERRASNDRSRSKHFHGKKDAEVDKDETCQKEGGNNESAVTSSRPSTAGWFSG